MGSGLIFAYESGMRESLTLPTKTPPVDVKLNFELIYFICDMFFVCRGGKIHTVPLNSTQAQIKIHLQSRIFHIFKCSLISHMNAGYYMYIEASGKSNGQTAYLTSSATYPSDNMDR